VLHVDDQPSYRTGGAQLSEQVLADTEGFGGTSALLSLCALRGDVVRSVCLRFARVSSCLRKTQYFTIRFTRRRIQMAERGSCDD
jgi:hypothetical protein